MKKLHELMHDLDARVDKIDVPAWKFMQKYFALFSGTFLTLLLAIFLFRVLHNRSDVLTSVICEDLQNIEHIFSKIDKECNILSIRTDRACIDFLTVEKFAGSTIGCFNVAYPKKWAGPYVRRNPTVQEKLYEIIKTQDGYYVIPGQGVTLPNKLIVGKDVMITSASSVANMLKPGGRLNFKGQKLGFEIKFKVGDWDKRRPSDSTIEKVSKILKEFNEAMPFAQGENSKLEPKSC